MKFIIIAVIMAITFSSCWLKPINYNDRELVPYLAAIAKAKQLRDSLGFSAVSEKAKITLEKNGDGYDAMLHVYQSISSRTIAFKRVGSGYIWIGEQEIFTGPRKFDTPDGELNETITLNYEVEPISGYPLNKLSLIYDGPDSSYTPPNVLSISESHKIIKRWMLSSTPSKR